MKVLTVNGGSSTIKCAIFRLDAGETPERVMRIVVENGDVATLLESLERHPEFATVGAVGHRVVHGMQHVEPELIVTNALLDGAS